MSWRVSVAGVSLSQYGKSVTRSRLLVGVLSYLNDGEYREINSTRAEMGEVE